MKNVFTLIVSFIGVVVILFMTQEVELELVSANLIIGVALLIIAIPILDLVKRYNYSIQLTLSIIVLITMAYGLINRDLLIVLMLTPLLMFKIGLALGSLDSKYFKTIMLTWVMFIAISAGMLITNLNFFIVVFGVMLVLESMMYLIMKLFTPEIELIPFNN